MSKSLQTILSEKEALEQLLVETGGEVTNVEEIVNNWMDEITSDLANKVDSYEYKQEMLEATAARFSARADKLYSVAKNLMNLSKGLKERLKFYMKESGLTEIKGNEYVFKLSDGKDKLVIDDEKKIPKDYFYEEIHKVLDKDLLIAALEDESVMVDGAHLETVKTLRVSINKGK
jgi:hypothetical protein